MWLCFVSPASVTRWELPGTRCPGAGTESWVALRRQRATRRYGRRLDWRWHRCLTYDSARIEPSGGLGSARIERGPRAVSVDLSTTLVADKRQERRPGAVPIRVSRRYAIAAVRRSQGKVMFSQISRGVSAGRPATAGNTSARTPRRLSQERSFELAAGCDGPRSRSPGERRRASA